VAPSRAHTWMRRGPPLLTTAVIYLLRRCDRWLATNYADRMLSLCAQVALDTGLQTGLRAKKSKDGAKPSRNRRTAFGNFVSQHANADMARGLL
jgi:hypothetical protein